MHEVTFSSSTKKFLLKCDKILYDRLTNKIKELQQNPFPQDAKRIKGRKEKIFRVRVGSYRILYIIIFERNTLFIFDINKRSRVY